jgi:hypothetical protein
MAMDRTNLNVEISPERTVLGKYLLGLTSRVTDDMLRDLAGRHQDHVVRQATLESQPDYLMRGFLVSLRTWLLKGTHVEMQTLSVRTPKTWKDHWKHDMLLSESKLWRYVASHMAPPEYKYETKEVETQVRVCPHNNTYFPEGKEHLEFLTWRGDAY